MRNIFVLGRRWSDKRYGNTYHTVRVYIDGKIALESGFTYGYGDAYMQTAKEELEKHGFITDFKHYANGSEPLWAWCQRHDVTLIRDVVDVARKRDL